MSPRRLFIGVALLAGASFSGSLTAQAEYGAGTGGSVLAFPFVSNDLDRTTIKISNAGPSTIDVHFVRVCYGIISGDDTCRKLGMSRTLTSNQTQTLRVESVFGTGPSATDPNCDFGYIVAYAESAAGSKIPISYNHLYGEVTIERKKNGKGLGTSPAISFRAIPAMYSELGAAGVLSFDGTTGYEKPSTKLRSTLRSGLSSTRTTKMFLGTFDIDAGGPNDRTQIDYVRYDEHGTPVSGSVSYVCAGFIDAKDVYQLRPGPGPNNMNTIYGSIEWGAVGDGPDPPAIFGFVIREEGALKRTLAPMWMHEDGATETTWTD